jgi:S1-C subfamily serine protease
MDDIETSSSVKTENLYEWLGLTVAEPSSEDAKNLNIQRETGVVVVKVKPGSSSDRAGLLSGMVILEIDSKEIKNIKDYREAAEKNKSRQTPILFLLEYNDSNFYRAIKPEKE